jgi:uncharacterized protein (TIGR02996 family)
MADETAFMRAILADPFNDWHRLKYADWLQSDGLVNAETHEQRADMHDRGEFIRVQIELANLPDERETCEHRRNLTDRERELHVANPHWLPELPGWERISEHKSKPPWFYWVRENMHIYAEFRRGFVSLIHCCSQAALMGIAADLFRAAPITEVEITDCNPYPSENDMVYGRIVYQWFEQSRRRYEAEGEVSSVIGHLHKDLFRAMQPHPKFKKRDERWNRRNLDHRQSTFPDANAAELALSRGIVTWGRRQVK